MRASVTRSVSLKSLRSRTHRNLCAVLVEARKGAALSQEELARRLRRSQSFIAKIEVGERRLDVLEFIEIARALNRDPSELLSRVLG